MNPPPRPAQLAVDELPQPPDLILPRHIAAHKLLRQPHRPQRQADCLVHPLVFGKGDLAATAADVHQHAASARSRLVLHNTTMNQPAFFEAGDDLDVPTRLIPDPCLKRSRIARIAHRRRRHRTHFVRSVQLHCFVEPLQRSQRRRHCLRRNDARLEDAPSQAGHLAILVHDTQPMLHHAANLQPAGVRSDVDGCKGLHDCRKSL